jgi:hypothetical protein
VDNPRRSVPLDYIFDRPHQLGTMRTGPDLINIGNRQTSPEWHHTHLYNPRLTSPGSIMPDFSYLYVRRPISGERSPDARFVTLPPKPTEAGLHDLLAAGDPTFAAVAGLNPATVAATYEQLSTADKRRLVRRVLSQLSPMEYLDPGYEIVPTDDARALVDYLLFLDRTTPPRAEEVP